MIITCPGCNTRYRVDAKALATPGGRTLRCAACGHSWRHPPAVLGTGPREPARADLPPLEPTLAAPPRREPVPPAAPPLDPALVLPPRPEPPHPAPATPASAATHPWAALLEAKGTGSDGRPPPPRVGAPPRRRRWARVGLPMLVVLIVLLAALYLYSRTYS